MNDYKIILFGGNRLLEKAPMTPIILFLKKQNIKFLLITDIIHLKKKISREKTFEKFLKEQNIFYKQLKNLSLNQIKKYIGKKTFGFSLNSIWKFKKDIIHKKRIKIILNKKKKKSKSRKIDTKITNRIWKSMIKAFIDYEFRNFNKK